MRIGLLGAAHGDEELLGEATNFLLGDARVDRAVYLGTDDTLAKLTENWRHEISRGTENTFLDRALELTKSGTPEEINAVLHADHQLERLATLHTIPPPPSRAIEMIDDRVILMVHDKSVLNEEDIANATMIVYGSKDELLLKRFGPRYFFTPGPLGDRKVGIIEIDEGGRFAVSAYDTTGTRIWNEVLQRPSSKLMVSR